MCTGVWFEAAVADQFGAVCSENLQNVSHLLCWKRILHVPLVPEPGTAGCLLLLHTHTQTAFLKKWGWIRIFFLSWMFIQPPLFDLKPYYYLLAEPTKNGNITGPPSVQTNKQKLVEKHTHMHKQSPLAGTYEWALSQWSLAETRKHVKPILGPTLHRPVSWNFKNERRSMLEKPLPQLLLARLLLNGID